MDVHLRLDADADGPVVVKSAAPGAVLRLQAEAARLARAVHPGVVTVVVPPDGATPALPELRTRYAGEPVAGWAGSLASVAGLGAAVASTLADLHAVGVVHGRIDASHILLGDDGRPRLCGLAPPEGDPTPPDDVAALAQVLSDLASRAGGADPPRRRSPRRGWPRSAAAGRRALALALDRALDPIPTRRPTARVFAETLLAAVPGAALPTPAPRLPPPPVAAAAPPPAPPPTAATGNPDQPPPPPADTEHQPSLSAPPPDPEPPAPATDRVPALDVPGPGAPEPHGHHHAEPLPRPPAGRHSDATPPAPDPGRRRAAAPPRSPLAPVIPAAGWSTAGEDEPPTRESPLLAARRARVGEAADAGTPNDSRRRVVVAAAVVALFVITAALSLVGVAVAGPGGDAAVPRPGSRAARHADCPARSAPAPPAADVDGDGCPEHLAIAGGTVAAGSARWTLGEPGDLVAVGDWDCRGGATPALLRPATGDVFVFGSWADRGEPITVTPARRLPGAVGLHAEVVHPGCDRLWVDLASGDGLPLEVQH